VAIQKYDWSGYDYLTEALAQGARGVVLENSHRQLAALVPPEVDLYFVENHRVFIESIAQQARALFKGKVLAITGSTGKSHSSLLIYSLLKQKFSAQFNEENRNSFFGACELLINIKNETELLVVELGARQQGELTALGELVRPQSVLLTNIQHSHLGGLKDLEGVTKMKFELLSGPWVKTVFLNAADPRQNWNPSAGVSCIRYSAQEIPDLPDLALFGAHARHTAAAVLSVGRYFGLPLEETLNFLRSANLPQPYLALKKQVSSQGHQILLDGRISTPESLENFRLTLLEMHQSPDFILLSGPRELGGLSEFFIAAAARAWATMRAPRLLYVGPSYEVFKENYVASGGRAQLMNAEKDAEQIFNLISALPENSFLAVQGNMEPWFYELSEKLA